MTKFILRRDEVADIVTQYFLSQGLGDELARQVQSVKDNPAAAFAGHEITVPAGETDPGDEDGQDDENGQDEVTE